MTNKSAAFRAVPYAGGSPQQDDDTGDRRPMPCPQCGGATTWGTLAMYGARCPACYRSWCEEANPHRVNLRTLTPEERSHFVHAAQAKVRSNAARLDYSARRPGISDGMAALQRLRTFEQRHGRPLNGAQRAQLVALEAQYGHEAAQDDPDAEHRLRDELAANAARVAAYVAAREPAEDGR